MHNTALFSWIGYPMLQRCAFAALFVLWAALTSGSRRRSETEPS